MYKLSILISLLMPTLAEAHAGHGFTDVSSIWHWLLEFEHIGWIVLLVVLLFSLWRKRTT